MAGEETLSSRVIFEGRAVRLRVDTVAAAGGRQTTREIVEHADCIAVVAVDNEDNVLLVRQFRKPVEKELLEIPAGGIDAGEDAATAVKREMQEETGFLPRQIKPLGGFYSAPGWATEYLYLYLATDLTPSRLHAEDTDEIEVVKVPVAEVPKLIASGKIEDSKSVAGLLKYLEHRRSG